MNSNIQTPNLYFNVWLAKVAFHRKTTPDVIKNLLFWVMGLKLSSLSYKQKVRWTEVLLIFILCAVVPYCAGLQLWDKNSLRLSYVVVSLVSIPVIVLFYRGYLEHILFKGKWLLSIVLFPVYLVIYEFYSRLSALVIINYFTFLPALYRRDFATGHPEKFDHLHQNLGYTILILLTATSLSMTRMFFLKENQLLSLQYAQVQLQLENLRSQVQPHFFFNTLNNLYNLSIQGSAKAPQMIAILSSIMRYVIYENREKVSLIKEIEFMENYFELERIRHTDPDLVHFRIQGDPEGIEIAPLLFLPLIENCFKHALQKDILENPVKIVMLADRDELVFQTSNKIIDKQEEQQGESGIGLANVKKRLELLYSGRHQLQITQEEGNYIVTISIKL